MSWMQVLLEYRRKYDIRVELGRFPGSMIMGMFDPRQWKILVNIEPCFPVSMADILITVLHEMIHSHQYMESRKLFEFNPSLYEKDYSKYANCPTELHAHSKAIALLESCGVSMRDVEKGLSQYFDGNSYSRFVEWKRLQWEFRKAKRRHEQNKIRSKM